MLFALFLWAYGILAIAEVVALRVGRASRRLGVFLAFAGPFLLIVLSSVSIGMPLAGTSWFGVPVTEAWIWGSGVVVLGPLMWALFTFPISPLVMIGVATAIFFRKGKVEEPDRVEPTDLADRYRTRAEP